jgi:hypothetical protein
MKAKDWIKQFKEQAAKADIKLWFLTSTGEWKLLADDEEMPKGRIQVQIGFNYYDYYNSK